MADEAGQVRDEQLEGEAELRRRLALAQIRQYPDPVLRLKAHEVEEFDGELRRLVERMSSLMRDANGVGLAATQVGVLRRLFVYAVETEDEPIAVVNPRIVDRGAESEESGEGCLSLQGVHVPVDRVTTITVEGRDVDGGELKLELDGLAARVVQHELDHLDGVLIIDRTDRASRREALAVLRPPPVLDEL